MKLRYVIAFCLFVAVGNAQDSIQIKSQVRQAINDIRAFVKIPNDALEHADINRNLTWLTKAFNVRGFNSSILPTAGESLFFASFPMEDNKPTVLLLHAF